MVERADLAGWSGGGRALLAFALAHPDRVRTLALVEPPAYWLLEEPSESHPGLDEFNELVYGLAGTEVSEDDLARFRASAVVELVGGHAHHMQSIDAFTEGLEAHLHRDVA